MRRLEFSLIMLRLSRNITVILFTDKIKTDEMPDKFISYLFSFYLDQ